MVDLMRVSRSVMASLVGYIGCHEAAAMTISARWGGGASKGTISKKLGGQLDWTLADVIALEDAAGQFPVTGLLARRMKDHPVRPAGDLVQASSRIAKECNEAVVAVLAALASAGADEGAEAVREIDEGIEALRAARALLIAGSGHETR